MVDEAGRLVAQVDLAYPGHRIAIELQSKRWHLNHRSFDADPARWNQLTLLGWRVFPVTWTAYSQQDVALCRMIARALSGPAR